MCIACMCRRRHAHASNSLVLDSSQQALVMDEMVRDLEEAEKWEGYQGTEHQESDISTENQTVEELEPITHSMTEIQNSETSRSSVEEVAGANLEAEVEPAPWSNHVRSHHAAHINHTRLRFPGFESERTCCMLFWLSAGSPRWERGAD